MKRIALALLAIALISLSGCAVNPGLPLPPPPTPAQVAAKLCPLAQEANSILQASGTLSPSDQTFIAKATPVVQKLCAAGAVVSVASLQDFATSSLPTILSIVDDSTLAAADKNRIGAGLLLAQVAIGSLK